ncbi:MAG: YkgJ family cysteine cluster protein, partial [Candidatus Aminicenantia bacterium]
CPFFQNNSCIIEEARPEMCRTYPSLLEDDFRFRLLNVIKNYEICPIVFNVYEELEQILWY